MLICSLIHFKSISGGFLPLAICPMLIPNGNKYLLDKPISRVSCQISWPTQRRKFRCGKIFHKLSKIEGILGEMAEENPKTPPTSPNKRHRVSAGTAEKLQPAKKPRTEGKEKSRSAFLLLITKDGTNYKHLNDEEYQSLMLDMATSLRKSRPVGGYPHIDWHSKTAGR